MNDLQTRVWQQLQSLSFDVGSPDLSFQRRLARENAWSMAFAAKVIEEYKRFIFLARFAGHPVTPSDEVDQCWHLHLTYTRSYWNDLCSDILGQPLHHNPTRGGEREDAKFDDWYAKTKSTYAWFFGSEPPEDIWPAASVRFNPDQRFKRVDISQVYLLPRRTFRRIAMISGAVSLGLVATGCAAATLTGLPTGLLFGIGVFVVVLILVLIAKASRGGMRRGCSSSSSGCSTPWLFMGDTSSSHSSDHHGSSDSDSGSTSDSSGSSDSGSSGCGSSGCGGGGCGGD